MVSYNYMNPSYPHEKEIYMIKPHIYGFFSNLPFHSVITIKGLLHFGNWNLLIVLFHMNSIFFYFFFHPENIY